MSTELINSHDFSKGAQIDKLTMHKWHLDALREIENGANFWVIRSGNGMVVARKIDAETKISGKSGIQILEITNGYFSYDYEIVDQNPPTTQTP